MPAHFLFAANPLWGHLRPQLSLALNLLNDYHDLYITFVTHSSAVKSIAKEIEKFGTPSSVNARLKVSPLGTITPDPPIVHMFELDEQMAVYLNNHVKTWAAGKSGRQNFDSMPSFVLSDMFLSSVGEALRSACSDSSVPVVPLFMFLAANNATALEFYAPDGHSQMYLDKAAQWKLEDPTTYGEMPEVEILAKAFLYSDGRVLKRHGLENIHDYEMKPQLEGSPMLPPVGLMLTRSMLYYKLCQGLVVPFPSDLEPGLAEKTEEVFGPGHSCFAVGPQVSPKVWAGDPSGVSLTPSEQATLDFLDAAQLKYGKKSVLYISFGTLFFPSGKPDLVYTLLETLVTADPPVPFLFAIAGAPPELATGITEYVSASGIGMVSTWAPQMKVLQHMVPHTRWQQLHVGIPVNCRATDILANRC